MNILPPGIWRRAIALVLALALALAGCANPPRQYQQQPPASITLAGIAIDGARPAAHSEAGMFRVWREGRAVEVRSGMLLYRGDFVETGPRVDAVIRFPNGSTLYMRPDSRGRLGSLSEAVGEFFARIKGVFSIESSFVRAAANGTAFLVRAQPDGAMSVTVHEGNVFVDSTRGLWPRSSLGPGTMMSAQLQASTPVRANEFEMRRTEHWADQLESAMPQASADSGSSVAGAVAVGVAIAAAAALLSSSGDDKPARGTGDSPRPTPNASFTLNTPNASSSLTAPNARGPGSADPAKPVALTCTRRGVTLSWNGVRGARDYMVTLQSRTSQRMPWATVASQASADQRAELAAEEGRRYRWWVQARDGQRTGPGSAMMYFDCPFIPR